MMLQAGLKKSVQNILKKSQRAYTRNDLRVCNQDTNRLFENSEVVHIEQDIDNQINMSILRLTKMRRLIEAEFDLIEQAIQQDIAAIPIASYCIETGKEEQIKEVWNPVAFPSWREVGLRFGLQHLIQSWLEEPSRIILTIARLSGESYIDPIAKQRVEEFLQTSNVEAWEAEKKHYKSLLLLKDHIKLIKKFKTGIGDNCSKRLRIAIQAFLVYVIKTIDQVRNLEFLPIEHIFYEFNENITTPKKSTFRIRINQHRTLSLDGEKTKFINELFANPHNSHDFSSEVKKYLLHDVNSQICAAFYEFGFVLGAYELITFDGLHGRVRRDLANLVYKM